MGIHSRIIAVAVSAFVVMWPTAVRAQSSEAVVTGQGTVELKRPPQIFRLQVEILAKGKDLKEALAKLAERREQARQKLDAFGFLKNAVDFGDPAISSEKTDRQKQMEMMVAQRMRRTGKPSEQKAKTNLPVVVALALKAEIPLKATTPEELLMKANELQEKIKAADLGGISHLKHLSPQEEELAEEAQDPSGGMEDSQPKRGEPIFLFVAKISEEEQAKALAGAFEKAKRQAGRLARAAGAEIGPLQRLDSGPTGVSLEDVSQGYDNPYYYQMMQRYRSPQSGSEEGTGEAVGAQPGKATFRISISATFMLKPGASK